MSVRSSSSHERRVSRAAMRHLILTFLATAALAVAPAAASAQTGQQIPEPGPILTHIGKTPMVELWDGGGGLPYLGAANSYNAGDWESALVEYHKSVYGKQIAKVDAVAAKWISHASGRYKLKRRHGGRGVKLARAAHHGHHGDHGHAARKTAIVFDVDETALSNYTAIEADGFKFGPQSQQEAQNEIGTAIEPTRDVFKLAQKKGIATFFITGRRESTRAHTDSNLKREGFTDYTRLVLKPESFTGSTVDYKAGARKAIEDEGYRIVASVGDQYSDLAGGHEDVAFKLPNPFYFLP
jgi:HAD superfamily, subfamily IIIB (Acid phosphatase)